MSQQACADFFAAVSSDATLQQEVATALSQANLEALYGNKEDWEIYSMEGRALTELEELIRLEAEGNAWVRLGAKHGYEFTAEEAVNKHQEIIQEHIAAMEAKLKQVMYSNPK